jgi:hypothetical protein
MYDYDYYLMGLSLAVILFMLIFGIALYCVQAFFMMKLFRKANVEAWKAWVPFVNIWTFLQLGGYPGWIILFAFAGFIPLVGWLGSIAVLVFECMAAYQIGLKLRKDSVWVVLYIFVGIVWMAICGLDRSTWDDRLGRSSLIPGTPTSGGYAYGVAGTAYQQTGTYQQPGAYPPGYYQQPGAYQQPGSYSPGTYQQPGSYQQPGAYPPGGYQQPGAYPPSNDPYQQGQQGQPGQQGDPNQQPGNSPSGNSYPPYPPNGTGVS